MATEYTGEVIPYTEYSGEVIPESNVETVDGIPMLNIVPKRGVPGLNPEGVAQKVVNFGTGAGNLLRSAINLAPGEYGNKILPPEYSTGGAWETVGSLFDPIALGIGGGSHKAAQIIPKAGPIVKGMVSGLASGGAIGGLSDTGSATEGAMLGGVVGGGLPAIRLGASAIGNMPVVKALTPGGYKNIADKYLQNIVGENKQPLISALSKPKEIVKGSIPTAAEVVAYLPEGSPIQALQKVISQEPGGISASFGERWNAQKLAREAALAFSGTSKDIENLITERAKAVTPLYDAVKKSMAKVDVSGVVNNISKIITENPENRGVTTPLRRVLAGLVKTQNGFRVAETNPQNLKSLSDDISRMISKTVDGKPQYDSAILIEAKNMIDKQIGIAEPLYKKALETFSAMSDPINKMRIGQALKDKLFNPVGTETPGMYLKAIDEEKKLLKKALGFTKKSVSDYLSFGENKAIKDVAADLERKVLSGKPAQATKVSTGDMDSSGEAVLPQLFSTPVSIVNYVLKKISKNADISPKINAYLADLHLNPEKMAKVLEKVPTNMKSKFSDIVETYGPAAVVNANNSGEKK